MGAQRPYVPPDQFHVGAGPTQGRPASVSAAVPSPVTMAPPKPMMPPHKAKVLHFDHTGQPLNSRQQPAPAEPIAQEPDEEHRDYTLLQPARATLVFDQPETEESDDTTGEAITASQESEELTEAEIKEIDSRKKSKGGIDKAWAHGTRKIQELSSENAALQQQLRDVLEAKGQMPTPNATTIQPVSTPPDVLALQKELDEATDNYHKNVLDESGKTHLKKMNELNQKIATATLRQGEQAKEDHAMLEATKAVLADFPNLVTNQAEAAYVDTAASKLPGGLTLTNLKTALGSFAKLKGWTKPSESATPNAEVEAMKAQAQQQAPASATVKTKGKIWRAREIRELIKNYPQKYQDLQPEIMRAYAEGRVKA